MRRVHSVITKKSIKRVLISGFLLFMLAVAWQFVMDRQALAAACAVPAQDNGTDTMTLNVPGAATYTLWVRMMVPDTTNNAINAQIDTTTCFNVGGSAGITPNTWTWVNYQNGVTGTPNSIALTQGTHTVKLVGTSPGVSVDRVILTSDTTCTPTGTGDNCATGDSTPPTVSVTAPVSGATVSGASATLSATASDSGSGVQSVQFKVDNVAVGNPVTTSPYSITWNSSSVANGSHTITAVATDNANNTSTSTGIAIMVSNSTSCTANPSVPTGLAVTGSSPNSVSLSWSASTPGANCTMQGYKIYRSGTLVTTVTSGTAYTDSGLNPSTSYSYTVAAVDTSNHASAQTAAVNGTTAADTSAPTAPTNLQTSLITNNSIALSWTDSTDNVGVTGYRVFRNGAQVGTSANATYTDTGLTANTQYTYTVKAYDASNNVSNASNSLSATTLQGSTAANGDVNGDGHVNITDLSILLSHYGLTNATSSEGDCNGDGTVNITDLSILLTNYGT